MKSLSKILLVLSFPTIAFASFEGDWTGKGVATNGAGAEKECSLMTMSFSQTPEVLTVNGAKFECGTLNGEWKKTVLKIVNGELWLGDRKLGTISEDTIRIAGNSSNGKNFFDIKLVVKGNELTYIENDTTANGDLVFSIEGKLNK